MTLREWIRLAVILLVAWFIYRSARRQELRRAMVVILAVAGVILFGAFVVIYGKLWHILILPAKEIPGTQEVK